LGLLKALESDMSDQVKLSGSKTGSDALEVLALSRALFAEDNQ
jgi:hypothetical protein